MAQYRIGGTISPAWSFPLSGHLAQLIDNYDHDHPIPVHDTPSADGELWVAAGMCTVSVVKGMEVVPPFPPSPATYGLRYGVKIKVSALGSVEVTNFIYGGFTIPINATTPVYYDLPPDTTADISVGPCELWVEITDSPSYPGDVLDYPSVKARFLAKAQADCVATVSCGGATQSKPVPEGAEIGLAYSASVSGNCIDGGSGSWAVGPSDPAPCNYTYDVHSNHATSSGGASGNASDHCYIDLSSTLADDAYGSMNIELEGDKEYMVDIALRTMEQTYPDDLHVYVNGHVGGSNPMLVSGGSGSASGRQRKFTMQSSVLGHGLTTEADEHTPMSCSLVSADLEENGDEPRLTRCSLRGWTFSGLSLSQDDHVVDDGSDLGTSTNGWSASDGGTVSTSGTYIIGPDGENLTRRWATPISCLAHSTLRVRARTVGAGNIPLVFFIPAVSDDIGDYSVEFGGGSVVRTDVRTEDPTPDKAWVYNSGDDGEWTNIDIPLYGPQNIADATDAWDTRWPLPTRIPRYGGVWRMGELQVGGMLPGVHLEIDNVALVILNPNSVHWDYVPTGYPQQGHNESSGSFVLDEDWPQYLRPDEELDSETTFITYRGRRFLLGRADGKQTVEEADITYSNIDTEAGRTTQVSHKSIEGLAATLTGADISNLGTIPRYPGLNADIDAPVNDSSSNLRDGYLNRERPAAWLCGAGALYSSLWSYGFDKGGSVNACALLDSVDWFPGCGDVFGFGGGSGKAIVLKAAAILRASGHGMALVDVDPSEIQQRYEPLEGDDVLLLQDGISRGTAITDASGYFQTDVGDGALSSPTAPPFTIERFAQDPARVVTIPTTWTRHRHRAAYLGPIISRPCTDRLFLGGAIFDPFTDPAPERLSRLLPYQQWRIVSLNSADEKQPQNTS